jgi:hypothetical protein
LTSSRGTPEAGSVGRDSSGPLEADFFQPANDDFQLDMGHGDDVVEGPSGMSLPAEDLEFTVGGVESKERPETQIMNVDKILEVLSFGETTFKELIKELGGKSKMNRKHVVKVFYTILTLRSFDQISLSQAAPFDDILLEAN